MSVTIALTRKLEFAASHSYESLGLSREKRERLYGTGAVSSHGHNYVLEATVEGEWRERTGMVVNIKDVDAVMRRYVEQPLDHKFLNLDVPFFADRAPTLENLTRFIWQQLEPNLQGCRLRTVRVYEDDEFWMDYHGEISMFQMTRCYQFSAAHRLHNPALSEEENREVFGKCNNPNGHGHNYLLEVTVAGAPDERTGTIGDIHEVDRTVQERVLNDFDHRHLNQDVEDFKEVNPTSEAIVQVIWRRLEPHLKAPKLERVRLWETKRSCFEYAGEGTQGT